MSCMYPDNYCWDCPNNFECKEEIEDEEGDF